jgi:hypothetical protein
MYNLRYHLASLVAVFLALALGLFLGSFVAERGYLDEQQQGLVEGLRSDFDELRTTNERLLEESERDRSFAIGLAGAVTDGLLDGRTILIVASEGRSDGLAACVSAVRGAGGTATTAVFSTQGGGFEDPVVVSVLSGGDDSPQLVPDVDLEGLVVEAVALEWTDGSAEDPLTDTLVDRGHLSVQQWTPGESVDGVILLADWEDLADPALVELAVRLDEAGAVALGAETQWRATGVVESCVGAGLSGVDAVDLPQGAFSVVWVLAERAEGHFGVGEGAIGLFPQGLTTEPEG